MKTPRKALYGLLVALVASAGIVSATFLFQNDFPAVPQSPVFTHCDTLKPSRDTVGSSSPGHLFFTCAYPWTHAFHSEPNTSAMPIFDYSRIAPYTDVFIIPISYDPNAVSCASIAGAIRLSPSIVVAFPATFTEWDYCAEYYQGLPGGLPAFSVGWHSP